MRAFLETINKEWFDDFVYISWYQLYNRGFEIHKFDSEDLENSLLNKDLDLKNDIIIGSVESTIEFFKACGIDIPKPLDYPEPLRKYLHRNIEQKLFKEVHNDYPYFIKPIDVKQFTGALVEQDSHLQMFKDFDNLNDETEVYISEPIKFESEYRCFVHDGKLVGIQYYDGDFRKYIDSDVVEKMISEFTDSPIAYTIDVGYVEGKGTVLIEVNDMWAIGHYGLDAKTYVSMCIDRLQEIKYKNK
jgi:hypothetical protein